MLPLEGSSPQHTEGWGRNRFEVGRSFNLLKGASLRFCPTCGWHLGERRARNEIDFEINE